MNRWIQFNQFIDHFNSPPLNDLTSHSWPILGLHTISTILKLHGSDKLLTNFVQWWCFCQNEITAIRYAVVSKKFDNFQRLKERVEANDLGEDKYSVRIKLPSVRMLSSHGHVSFSQDCSLLFGSLALEALLIGVHCKKRYINV